MKYIWVIKFNLHNYYNIIPEELIIFDNWMKLIYLHLYKDTYLLLMQAYKLLQRIYNTLKIKKINVHSKIKNIC